MSYRAFMTEEHEAIRELARDFAEGTLAPIASEIDKTDHFPEEVKDQMGELGFFGLKIPEEYGGMGLDMRSYVSVNEEIGRKSAAASVLISQYNSLSTQPIIQAGTPEQKEKYLPKIATGEYFFAFGLTEPGAGSDAGSITTKAVRDGDDYILNGRKCFITGAPIATHTVVYAKTAPDQGVKGISCFVVDMTLPGVSVGRHEDKMGQRGIPVSDVLLEDVRVPADCMVGEENRGFINAMKTLSIGRIGVSAMALGIAQAAIDEAVAYTKERKQFGKPLASFQALRFMMADMETKLNAARGLVYNAAWMIDNGEDGNKAASMAKYFTTEAAIDIVNKALQLHGGYGYSKEYTIERLYRDVRITNIYEGSSQVQQMVVAGALLK